MRQRREINAFSMSFLDLLSGALAAVIILFIIVPKTDIQSQVADQNITELKSNFFTLDSIIETLKATMPENEIAVLIQTAAEMKSTISSLEDATLTLRNRLSETKQQNEELQNRLSQADRRLRTLIQAEKTASAEKAKAQPTPKKSEPIAKTSQSSQSPTTPQSEPVKEQTKVSGKGDFMFGLNPAFVVLVNWEDEKADVDLYLKSDGRFCDGQNRSTSFGKWIKMPKKFITQPHEAIIQKELKPGTYEVYAHMYKPRNSKTTISGFTAVNPEGGDPMKVDFGQIEISSSPAPYRSGGGTLLGTIELTDKTVRFNKAF
ncbi:MAG: hypothetical protein IPI60_04325 [Saprospiraceae bacterium]|nr:hypothetical protein [Saprospiraceae bacterium]